MHVWKVLSAATAALALSSLAGPALAQDGTKPATVTIELKNGDTVSGTLVERTDEQVVVDSEVFGRLAIPTSEIKPGPVFTSTGTGLEQMANDVAAAVDSVFFPGWSKSFTAGVNGSSGNSEAFSIFAALQTGYEDETDRWDVLARYFRTASEGDVTQNEFKGQVTKDWLVPDERYFFFGQGLYQYDDFQAWLHRVGAFGGVGYQLIKEDRHALLGRLGAGAQYEFGEIDDITPELFIGLEYEWKIDDAQSLRAYNTLFPSIDPFLEDFRNVTGVAYQVALAAGKGLSFRIGAENEHQSEPGGSGRKKNDLKYYAGIGFEF